MNGRRLLSTVLQLLALWTIAVVQPVLDLLSRSPEFFVAHRAGPADVWLFVGGLMLVAPALLVTAWWLGSLAGARARDVVLSTIVGGLTALVAMQAVQRLGIDTWPAATLVAVTCGAAAGVIHHRYASARVFFTALALAVLIVPLVFVTRPGIAGLVVPRPIAEARDGRAPGRARPVPVVMIVFDELPLLALLDADRRIDEAFYPHFAALARDGIWFRNATTLSDYTRWALPPILSGLYPRPESVPTPADHPNTLFTLLAGTHRLEVTEAVTDLCPPELCQRSREPRATRLSRMGRDAVVVFLHVLLTGDLRSRLPDVTGSWAGFGDWQARWHQADGRDPAEIAGRPDILRGFIDGISAQDPQPSFYFLHSLLSHHPYLVLPDGRSNVTHTRVPGPTPTVGTEDEWANAQSQQRQLLQTAFIDGLIGRLTARLKDQALYDETLVIITSDHGVAFQPGRPLRAFTDDTAAEIMRVPLIIKFPSTAAASALYPAEAVSGLRVSDRNVETVDIPPTVAGALGISLPWNTDGVSLLDSRLPERARKRFNAGQDIRWYGAEGPPLDEALRRTYEWFDGPSNRFRVPRPQRFADLVGRPLSGLRVVPDDTVVEVEQAWRYASFEPGSPLVPFDVSGRVRGNSSDGPRGSAAVVPIALAINGVVRAVTRTWHVKPDSWLATPPLDAWRAGRNELELFAVEEDERGVLLRRLRLSSVRLADLNLISGAAERAWGVKQSGFHANEGTEAAPFRWTRGRGVVTVPLADPRPRTLRLEIARASRPDTRLTVTVNDCVLFEGPIARRRWEQTWPLEQCRVTGHELRIAVTSDTSTGPGADRRRLGVAVRRISLE